MDQYRILKFRIYPNEKQKLLLENNFKSYRLVYNYALDFKEEVYKKGLRANFYDTQDMLMYMKNQPQYKFLKEADSQALLAALKELDSQYKIFFKTHCYKPCFKSKSSYHEEYWTTNPYTCRVYIEDGHIRLPKIGFMKIKLTREVKFYHSVKVERFCDEYYVCLKEKYQPEKIDYKYSSIGLDMGLKHYYTASNGRTINNPEFSKKSKKKLKRLRNQLKRKTKGSKNYDKALLKYNKALLHVNNQREDFQNKESTKLAKKYELICVEDLKVKSMIKSQPYIKYDIYDAAWNKFIHKIEYKEHWHGGDLVKISAYYPSSQICSCCGYKNTKVKSLSVRNWTCPKCGAVHDRDNNAAINIQRQGLKIKYHI